jgi:hypothetical protein
MINRTAYSLDEPVASLQAGPSGAGEELKKRERSLSPRLETDTPPIQGKKDSLDGRWLLTRAPL